MTSLTPLPTIYNGTKYRSRLEARWALFFTKLGEPFQYEPEGFDLGPPLGCYLPDFWLPECGLYVEIKPDYEQLRHSEKPGFSVDPLKAGYCHEQCRCHVLAKSTGTAMALNYGHPSNHKTLFYGQSRTGQYVDHWSSATNWRWQAMKDGSTVRAMLVNSSSHIGPFFDYEWRPIDRVVGQDVVDALRLKMSLQDGIIKHESTQHRFWG